MGSVELPSSAKKTPVAKVKTEKTEVVPVVKSAKKQVISFLFKNIKFE